jgi:hypothetical protein
VVKVVRQGILRVVPTVVVVAAEDVTMVVLVVKVKMEDKMETLKRVETAGRVLPEVEINLKEKVEQVEKMVMQY